jgi:hypothetical protein
MPGLISLCATALMLVHPALTRPVTQPELEVSFVEGAFVGLDKRGESGPKIGGANFPDPSIIGFNGMVSCQILMDLHVLSYQH